MIDADALKDKLQQHHDFWVMAWGGFSKMPISDKKRVDEITNCIAEVVNAPTIEPKRGEWIETSEGTVCSVCGKYPYDDGEYHIANWKSDFCPNCDADMRKESE